MQCMHVCGEEDMQGGMGTIDLLAPFPSLPLSGRREVREICRERVAYREGMDVCWGMEHRLPQLVPLDTDF